MSGPTALASSVPRCKWRPGRSTSLPNTEKESRVRSAVASVPCTRCLSRREEREEDRLYQQSPQQSTTHQLLNPARGGTAILCTGKVRQASRPRRLVLCAGVYTDTLKTYMAR
ncbi:unnamed protein product [Arctogadus glacialis]